MFELGGVLQRGPSHRGGCRAAHGRCSHACPACFKGYIPAGHGTQSLPTREKSPFIVLAGGDGLADDRLVADLATALERNRLRLRLERSKGPERDLLTLLNNPDIDVALIPTDAIESLPRRVREVLMSAFVTFSGFRASDCTS